MFTFSNREKIIAAVGAIAGLMANPAVKSVVDWLF
jgi:hypothetical protein